MIFIVGMLVLVFGSVFAVAQEVEVQIVEDVDCALGKDTRRVEVLTNGPGCTALYFKFGKSQKIAWAKHGVDVCLDALTSTKENLEKARFKCQ